MPHLKRYDHAAEFTLDVIGGKWKAQILGLLRHRPMRYGELRSAIPNLSDKMLTQRLHDLVDDGLVAPPDDRARSRGYRVTPLGGSLGPALSALRAWGDRHAEQKGVRIVPSDASPGSG